ncbi:hypothetical protein [Secundilactobacillus yichangensis]|uniref:hypothetical protein n=1 Tax=Secundilactobacillus yichangensis TaxID=2799580 RepID=UPI001940EB72|nr:hypothetical protein [Secundilactobacillus yichangensis]
MSNNLKKGAITAMLSASILGGVFVAIPNPSTNTTAHAAAYIPYSQYASDVNGLKAALGKARPEIRSQVTSLLPSTHSYKYKNAYTSEYYGIYYYLGYLSADIGTDHAFTKAGVQDDYDCMVASYNVFRNRLPKSVQGKLESSAHQIQHEIDAHDGGGLDYVDYYDIFSHEADYLLTLRDAVSDYGGNYDGVASKPKAPSYKSHISKLSATKTASKKYVKVTGIAKLYKSANYANIKTYKGYRYVKLSSKHTFSKTIYAPKAKSVKVSVGYYSHDQYKPVTSTKTVYFK